MGSVLTKTSQVGGKNKKGKWLSLSEKARWIEPIVFVIGFCFGPMRSLATSFSVENDQC